MSSDDDLLALCTAAAAEALENNICYRPFTDEGYKDDDAYYSHIATAALLAAQTAWEAWLRGVIADEILEYLAAPASETNSMLKMVAHAVKEGGTHD